MTRSLVVAASLAAVSCSGGAGPFPYLTYEVGTRIEYDTFGELPGQVRRAALFYPRAGERDDAPISLTSSDGQGLQLVAMRARGVVDGPLAFTEIQLTFRNPRKRRVEGRFEIALPPDAAVSRLAMKVNGAWQEAEVVERQRAREVYESYLHQRVDPALLEHKAGNAFRARIFPIEANENKDIIISYSHELTSEEDAYEIPLVGLTKLGALDINVRRGDRVVRVREYDFAPKQDFVVKPDTGVQGLYADDMVVARVSPRVSEAPDHPKDLLVLVDSSASAAGYYHREVSGVHALIRAVRAAYGDDVSLRVACFDQSVTPVFEGKAGGFGKQHADALLMRRALGASDLEGALAWASQAGFSRVLLVSDGIASAGADDLGKLQRALGGGDKRIERLDVIAFGNVRDEGILRGLAAGTLPRDGVLLDPTRSAGEWAGRLGRATASNLEVAVDGAEWVWPRRLEGVQPGDSALIYARVPAGKLAKGAVDVKLSGSVSDAHHVEIAPGEAPLLEREWVQARIDQLLRDRVALAPGADAERAAIDAEVVRLSTGFRVLTPHTALLVLENDYDYQQFGLSRTALNDVLSVDATGVRVLSRGAPRPDRFVQLTAAAPAASRKVEAPRTTAMSQPANAGEINGKVVDQGTGEALPGVTVVATSPSLQGTVSAITDADGFYRLESLPPGNYQVTFYYSDVTVRRDAITVRAGRATALAIKLDTSKVGGEVITIESREPMIDTTSTAQSVELTENIPSGRSYSEALGASAGSSGGGGGGGGDDYGVSFSGSASPESSYVVDGINTTGLEFGSEGDGLITQDFAVGRPRALARSSKRAYTGRMLKVMKLLENDDVDAALVEALRWRAEDPGDVMALVGLGEALEAKGCTPLAARAYGSIIDLFPSRGEMRRFAAARLARLGPTAAKLSIDAAQKAVDERPDQPTSYRLLAYALILDDRPREAVDILIDAMGKSDPRGRFARAMPLLRQDLGLVAAVWLAKAPEERAEVRERLAAHDIMVPMEPSLHFVLSWETDANDVDLYVTDKAGKFERRFSPDGDYSGNVSDGWGPEWYDIVGSPPSDRYHVWAHYKNRQMMGYGFGHVQVIAHDGAGRLHLEWRPFAVMSDDAYVDLGDLWPRQL